MKTSPRPSRRGQILRFSPRRKKRHPSIAMIPPLKFTVPNFKDGRSITYTLTRTGFVFQLSGDRPVVTNATTYAGAAAKARAKYNLPAIGCASYAKEIAA